MSIYKDMVKAGIPIASHESDLYVKCTLESKAIVLNYKYKRNVTAFTSQTDHTLWYDIPFAYRPFWDEKERIAKKIRKNKS